jgi:polyferredoxin
VKVIVLQTILDRFEREAERQVALAWTVRARFLANRRRVAAAKVLVSVGLMSGVILALIDPLPPFLTLFRRLATIAVLYGWFVFVICARFVNAHFGDLSARRPPSILDP